MPDLVLMGRALGAFGLKGEIRIFYHGADISLLPAAGTVWLGAEPLLVRPYQVVNVRHHKGRLLLSVAGVGDRDRAEEFRGCFLYVDKQVLPPLAEDEFYFYQLKGAVAYDLHGQAIGRVSGLANSPAQDMVEIENQQGQKALVPLVKPILRTMDLSEKRLVFDLPPGLLEAQGWEDGG